MIFTLVTILMTALQATDAMTYEQARNEALFLTDKMAYELNLSDAQYEAAYEINLDYLMSVTGYHDVNGLCWERRNADLRFILYSWQWEAFRAATYFFRPLYWDAGYWHFGVYARYPRRDYFYFGRPHFYASYRGGHSWRMNGGHSYYEHRRDMFRPGHVGRDHHVGMRTGWDRGDYRGSAHGNSSTRVTVGDGHRNGGHDNSYHNNSGSRSNGNFHGNSNGSRRGDSYNGGSRSNSGRSLNEGSRSSNSSIHSSGSFSGGSRSNSSSHSSGSFSGGSSSHSSGGFSGGSRGGSSTRGGSNGGGSRSGSSRR